MNKRIFIIFLTLFLLAFGFLSFLSMSRSMDSAHVSFPFPVSRGVNCYQEGSLALLIHHISELQTYTNTNVAGDSGLLMLFFSMIVFVFIATLIAILHLFSSPIRMLWYAHSLVIEKIIFLGSRKIKHWISVHFQRDPYALQGAHGSFCRA